MYVAYEWASSSWLCYASYACGGYWSRCSDLHLADLVTVYHRLDGHCQGFNIVVCGTGFAVWKLMNNLVF